MIKWNRFLLWFKSRTGETGSIAIGIATFGALTNWKILNPLFVRWLYWGDPSTSYLGWQFFRKTPLLQFPLGLNPNYGTGFSSSIMFTDSVPLIAIPLKYLSFLLPSIPQLFFPLRHCRFYSRTTAPNNRWVCLAYNFFCNLINKGLRLITLPTIGIGGLTIGALSIC